MTRLGSLLFHSTLLLLLAGEGLAADQFRVYSRETFETLDNWTHERLPKVERATEYSSVLLDGKPVLRAHSESSGSFLVYTKSWNIREYPVIRWKWLVENVYRKGDGATKAGNDFPLRVYVLFEYDPAKAAIGDRLLYASTKLLYGTYPPHSSISYVWESTGAKDRVTVNPYSAKNIEITRRSGTGDLGVWQKESADVLADYRRVFGREPPERATLGIISDSDNTGESATAFMGYIEIGAP